MRWLLDKLSFKAKPQEGNVMTRSIAQLIETRDRLAAQLAVAKEEKHKSKLRDWLYQVDIELAMAKPKGEPASAG